MSLEWVGQDDFAVGTLLGLGQDQLNGVGLARATNGFFDDDGDVHRRGVVVRQAGQAPAALTWIWSGYVGVNYRVLVATAANLYSVSGGTLTALGVGLAGPVQPAIVGDKIYLPNGVAWDGATVTAITWPPVLPAGTRHLASAFGRLLIGTGNVLTFSAAGDAASFASTDYHKLPAGTVIQGITQIRDRVLVFTNYGLFVITGMAFDLTDDLGNVQQTLERLTPEISLLHESGLCDWAGNVVAVCVNGVFAIDALNPPVPVSDSISSQYMNSVRLGYRPGGAKVFRNHLFLPWLDNASTPKELWVCRLNRPVRSRQTYYPWSQWDGYPTKAVAFDVDLRTTNAPVFQAALSDGYRIDLTASFPPFTSNASAIDPDGLPLVFDVETRDYPTGNGQPNHARRLRLWYAAVGEGQVKAAYSYGTQVQRYQDVKASGRTYAQVKADYADYASLLAGRTADVEWLNPEDRFWNVLDPRALVAPGVDPMLWNFVTAERQRYIRARFRSTDGIAQIKIRRVEFAVRPTTHRR